MTRICPDCSGKGFRPGDLTDVHGRLYFKADTCKACDGKGTYWVIDPIQLQPFPWTPYWTTTIAAQGTNQ